MAEKGTLAAASAAADTAQKKAADIISSDKDRFLFAGEARGGRFYARRGSLSRASRRRVRARVRALPRRGARAARPTITGHSRSPPAWRLSHRIWYCLSDS